MAVGAKIAKTADRKKVMDTTKSTDCPKCGKGTRIVKRVKDRERALDVIQDVSGCDEHHRSTISRWREWPYDDETCSDRGPAWSSFTFDPQKSQVTSSVRGDHAQYVALDVVPNELGLA